MFAILISEENLPKIKEHQNSLHSLDERLYARPYHTSPVNWYYVRGYVDQKGTLVSWTCFPEELFNRLFESNAEKVKTDWDQIVRK